MSSVSSHSTSEIIERLERALRRFGGEAELSFHGTRDGTTRFAASRVTQTGEVRDQVVQARVAIRQAAATRVGAARVNALDDATLAEALAQARALALGLATGVAEADFAGFADGSEPLDRFSEAYDETTARADAEARASLIGPAFRATAQAKMSAAGLCSAGETTLAVVTSAGCRRTHRYTRARFDLIASDGSVAARRGRDGRSWATLTHDHEALIADTVARAERSRDPVTLPPGSYDAILEPPALAELVEWMCLIGFGARTVVDGSSPLAGRLGQPLTGPLTLYDDALTGEADCPTLPFDAEGMPRRRVTLIDGGVARAVVHDRATAQLLGAASTGHAAPIADELSEGAPLPMHAMVAAGSDDEAQLLARVERGLYVARFHYVNGLLDTRRALMTGMTRDGVWLVEDGKLSRAVANLRWTESLLEAGTRIAGISRTRRLCAAGLNEGWYVCPTILFRGWKFTG
jgi:predicted Zn-dependent protease